MSSSASSASASNSVACCLTCRCATIQVSVMIAASYFLVKLDWLLLILASPLGSGLVAKAKSLVILSGWWMAMSRMAPSPLGWFQPASF